MPAYSRVLKKNRVFHSIWSKGKCYDNSVKKMGILKQKMYYGITYYSFGELKEAIE